MMKVAPDLLLLDLHILFNWVVFKVLIPHNWIPPPTSLMLNFHEYNFIKIIIYINLQLKEPFSNLQCFKTLAT